MSTKGTNEELMLECAREAVAKRKEAAGLPSFADEARRGLLDNSYTIRVALSGITEYASRVDPIMEQMLEALEEARDYFDERQDADHNGHAFIANEEMKIFMLIDTALMAAKKETKS